MPRSKRTSAGPEEFLKQHPEPAPAEREHLLKSLGTARESWSQHAETLFTIEAWNEFGEGGGVAPTRGENDSQWQAIRHLFPNTHTTTETTQP